MIEITAPPINQYMVAREPPPMCVNEYTPEHPLQCKDFIYTFHWIYTVRSTDGHALTSDEPIWEMIKNLRRRPDIAWAEQQSFDGLYFMRTNDYEFGQVLIKFGAYLLDKHITFWNLKFSNT